MSKSTEQLSELTQSLGSWVREQELDGNKEAARRAKRAHTTLRQLWNEMARLDFYNSLSDEEKEQYKDWAKDWGIDK